MSNLISGKEAFNAWYDGIDVQVKYLDGDWKILKFPYYGIDIFKSADHVFRPKTKTIMLGNIEIPAPFEPKEGDEVWFISDDHPCGYAVIDLHKQKFQLGAWRSEEEIKQVVEALRSVFK